MDGSAKHHPRKKQKTMPSVPLALCRLATHAVDFPETLSPGAFHSCRVAVADLPSPDAPAYDVFAASGRHIYRLSAPRSPADAGFSGERGKEGVHIPVPSSPAAVSLLDAVPHRAEVQDLKLYEHGDGSAVLASVDCYGRAVLAHLRCEAASSGADTGAEGSGSQAMYQPAGLCQLQPTDLLREAGWAGVAVAPGQPTQAAVARHFAKDITLFDGPMAVRTIHTLYHPNAIQLLSTSLAPSPEGGPLVAVAEGPQVSLWDVRAGGKGTRVARLGPGPHHGPLYALAASDDGGLPLLGAAGADRGVLVYDPRKWAILHRWPSCLKYEATALHFSSASPQYCIVGGLDYEVLCGEWAGNKASRLANPMLAQVKQQQQQPGRAVGPKLRPDGEGQEDGPAERGMTFRGDARWLGLAKAQGQDVLAGLTGSGQLYVAEFAAKAAS